MKQFIALSLLAFLISGCASMSFVTESGDEIDLQYSGTSAGAKDLVDAIRRREESKAASKTAKAAVKNGLPVDLQSSKKEMKLSSAGLVGYGYGGYGGYGYDQYGYGPYQVSQDVLASEAATFGRYHGRLPSLYEGAPNGFSPGQQVNREPCPKGKRPVTVAERTSCLEEAQRVMLLRIYKRRHNR